LTDSDVPKFNKGTLQADRPELSQIPSNQAAVIKRDPKENNTVGELELREKFIKTLELSNPEEVNQFKPLAKFAEGGKQFVDSALKKSEFEKIGFGSKHEQAQKLWSELLAKLKEQDVKSFAELYSNERVKVYSIPVWQEWATEVENYKIALTSLFENEKAAEFIATASVNGLKAQNMISNPTLERIIFLEASSDGWFILVGNPRVGVPLEFKNEDLASYTNFQQQLANYQVDSIGPKTIPLHIKHLLE
jgi:hypothetical protein